MAKMVDIEKLKPLLEPLLTEENSASTIEGILAIAQDYDEEGEKLRTEEAVKAAKDEAAKEYNQRLHDMFFKGASDGKDQGKADADQHTDPEVNTTKVVEEEEIFTTVANEGGINYGY